MILCCMSVELCCKYFLLFLSQKLKEVKRSHNELLEELETSNRQLKQEQSRTLTLGNELKAGSSAQRRVVEVSWGHGRLKVNRNRVEI